MPRRWNWRPLHEIPAAVQRAVIAAEDARYVHHWGIDPTEVEDALEGRGARLGPRGASTITMQTVKNIFLWPGRSYLRKVIEAAMALVAGAVWGKARTLELYLNVIEWGEGIYGIDAASWYYYGRDLATLTPAESAALAAILPSPRASSPRKLSGVARRRYQRVLREADSVRLPRKDSR